MNILGLFAQENMGDFHMFEPLKTEIKLEFCGIGNKLTDFALF